MVKIQFSVQPTLGNFWYLFSLNYAHVSRPCNSTVVGAKPIDYAMQQRTDYTVYSYRCLQQAQLPHCVLVQVLTTSSFTAVRTRTGPADLRTRTGAADLQQYVLVQVLEASPLTTLCTRSGGGGVAGRELHVVHGRADPGVPVRGGARAHTAPRRRHPLHRGPHGRAPGQGRARHDVHHAQGTYTPLVYDVIAV